MEPSVNIATRTPGPETVTGAQSEPSEARSAAKGGDFFRNLIDIINPLQHIPVISTIYRAITGDEITPAAKLAGGALFGGPLGALAAIAGIAVEETTGRDVGEHLVASITGNDDAVPAPDQALQQAQLNPPPPAQIDPAQIQAQREPPRDTIIWNGVRQLPVPQSSTQSGAAPPARPAPELTAQSAMAPAGAAPAVTLVSTTPSAAWLTTALSQAQTIESAKADGETPARPQGQPWIADAMMQALDQYDALARQRQRQPDIGANP